MTFEPVAIIGRSCLLPAAHSPHQLWQNTLAKKDCLNPIDPKQWRLDPTAAIGDAVSWQNKTGRIEGFDEIFNPDGYALSADFISQQDSLAKWLLHTGRTALTESGYEGTKAGSIRVGAIIGNLSYPTDHFNQYAELRWLLQQDEAVVSTKTRQKLIAKQPHPNVRFMSGYPVHLLAQALKLKGPAFAIDAACASAIYAIKLACDVLHNSDSDLMLAGGINATDGLFLHMGFNALQALSRTGQSRPLHKHADGLIPAHGAAVVVLKRLKDAVAAKDSILGVIRGIGLSNDGNNKGFLMPAETGQIRAMQQAYTVSGLKPQDISWIECHATGTTVGDATEIRSMRHLFPSSQSISIGALKGNLGHTITASGAAALINVLSAFEHQLKPPTREAEEPAEVLHDSPFKLLKDAEEWQSKKNQPRRAAINCFGFGGNNAHLLLEEWQKKKTQKIYLQNATSKNKHDIAIVGLGIVAGKALSREEFTQALFKAESQISPFYKELSGGYLAEIELDVKQTRFPPSDLQRALGQQLAILKASQEALAEVKKVDSERTAVLIGMQCDTEIARTSLRWRLSSLLAEHDAEWLDSIRDNIYPTLQAAHVLGMMPNVVANRLNLQFDFKDPSYSVSSEELSGITALKLGMSALQNNETNMAVIGAVDICCEVAHKDAINAIADSTTNPPGDAAIVMVLKRFEDAQKHGDKIYGILPSLKQTTPQTLKLQSDKSTVTQLFGHAHAASGLLNVAAAVLACHERLLPATKADIIKPWAAANTRQALIEINTLSSQTDSIFIKEHEDNSRISALAKPLPKIYFYTALDKSGIISALKAGITQSAMNNMPTKLAIVAQTEQELQSKQQTAMAWLQRDMPNQPLPDGIYFREKPLNGELAFVFTGATTSYPKMGLDLLLHFPELVDRLAKEIKTLPDIIHHLNTLNEKVSISMFEELKTYSFMTQFHALFSREILKLKPDACIGYCSGESNGLAALQAWKDIEQLFTDIDQSAIYKDSLSGQYSVLEKSWQKLTGDQKWSTWRVLASVERIKEAIIHEPFVRLTIINSPNDCIIAGNPQACEHFLTRLNITNAKRLNYSMIIHCDEFTKKAELWYQLHYRRTYPVPGVRFYSAGSGHAYQATAENAAQALLKQASATVDFPAVIRNAWHDGVRIFVEHGPRNLCSRWITDCLGDKEHLALSLDMQYKDPTLQAAMTVAQLLVAGANVNFSPFQ